ncbi:MAG: type II secretion system F family protein [Tepidisphaeraceae bacterium]
MMIPILVAAAVATLAFAIVQIVGAASSGERRKLQRRLSAEQSEIGRSSSSVAITMRQADAGVLGGWSFFDNLSRTLLHAYPDLALSRFLLFVIGAAVVTFLITQLITGTLVVALLAAMIAGYIPFLVVHSKRSRRQRALNDQLPEALDFLSRILRAGHSLSTGLQMMSQELPRPLSEEFRRAYDQHSLGASIDDALKDASTRIESTDFAFFVTAVLIQRQTGGDLSEVLGNISTMIRQRMRLQQHVKAKTAEGRFTGYILSAFPLVMFFIAYALNPDYAGVLLKTSTGLMLLGVAFGLQMMGLYFIRKITTVRV